MGAFSTGTGAGLGLAEAVEADGRFRGIVVRLLTGMSMFTVQYEPRPGSVSGRGACVNIGLRERLCRIDP
jgi:hypothetical protein